MRPRQASSVSCSSTPDGIPVFLLDLDWFIELDWAVSLLDRVELGPAASRLDIGDLSADASIFPSLAHPPTMSPNTVTQNAVLNMTTPPLKSDLFCRRV